ncbi:YihY/virulence factor BrkB family protein [Croceibacterium sp. LX-88]|uniref:YihY/virulence factor BrkB family protein n=1 Tax=Croceibacterium selenioxidans TaxID=2838833 RepID=A0ABS5W626_9SPHN|nr:YihY/virulence factor BrkB family protein [Croceibacterium selenioxidans]MBT2135213.1 YihY/virulence factor BrkB family protein [Croceibacterium selenioxidans]
MAPGLTDHDRPGPPVPDRSPEARRKEALRHRAGLPADVARAIAPGSRPRRVVERVLTGAYNDGFIHAGNLAYMTLLAIFPFAITAGAIFTAIFEEGDRMAMIDAVLAAVPPVVAEVIEPVARDVVIARSGWFLWAAAFAGLWTVGSLIETIRDILRRAYGTRPTQAFWKYRVFSTGIILAAVVLLMLSLLAQVLIGAAQEVISVWFPELDGAMGTLTYSRMLTAAGLYVSLYMLFYILTPAAYRKPRYPKWPGALLVTVWWAGVTLALPPLLRTVFAYDLTYGSLAGFMIVLFFFWLVGLGMVMGAELNAALAETPEEEEDRIGQTDNRVRVKNGAGKDTKTDGKENTMTEAEKGSR